MNGERHGFAGPSLGLGPLDRSAPTPLWAQVKTALTRQIFEYGLEPGARLPSETALCQAFDVSRTVVREALAQLVNEGLIYRHQGKGAFVRDRRDEQDFVASTVGFTGELTEKRHEVARRVLFQGIVLPSPRVRKYLGLPVDQHVFAIDRVMTVDGVPRAIIRCCLLASAVPGLEEVSLENRSLHDTLMRSYGIRLNRAERWIEAITLAEDDAALLDVEAGRAALKVESVASDGRDSPMEYYNMVCLTDRSRLHVSVRSHGQ